MRDDVLATPCQDVLMNEVVVFDIKRIVCDIECLFVCSVILRSSFRGHKLLPVTLSSGVTVVTVRSFVSLFDQELLGM